LEFQDKIDIKREFVQYKWHRCFQEFTMKKGVLFGLLAVCVAAGLLGDDFSINGGAGALFGYTFTRYGLEADMGSPGSEGKIKSDQSMDRLNYGGFLFFDATYGELMVTLQGGTNSYHETMETKSAGGSWNSIPNQSGIGTGTELALGFSLMGKYPFKLDDKFTLFPLLGAEYQVALIQYRQPEDDSVHDRTSGLLESDRDKNGDPYPLSAWNSFWIDVGVGLDYTLGERFFLRGEFVFGFRLQTAYETGALEMLKEVFDAKDPEMTGLTGSPTLKFALGYKFWNRV
jgi:hypothetical protein